MSEIQNEFDIFYKENKHLHGMSYSILLEVYLAACNNRQVLIDKVQTEYEILNKELTTKIKNLEIDNKDLLDRVSSR